MSKTTKARVFVPLTKVDEEQRLVYGTITQEILDKAGEVMDYATSKPNFQKWSGDIEKASNGLSKGNVRVMHGLSVAGKLTDIAFDDEAQTIDVCAKVVDDAEWLKVQEGCYTGFSVGGSYGKKWTDPATKMKKYTAVPNEVSLVDNPCVGSATFTMIKADGAEEEVSFKDELIPEDLKKTEQAADHDEDGKAKENDKETKSESKEETAAKEGDKPKEEVKKADVQLDLSISNAEVADRAGELAKADGTGKDWMDFIIPAREQLTLEKADKGEKKDDAEAAKKVGKDEDAGDKAEAEDDDEAKVAKAAQTPAGVEQKWNTTDGKAFTKKADAVAHQEKLNKTDNEEDDAATKLEKSILRIRDGIEAGASVGDEPAAASIFSLDRIDDLHKAVLELEGPRDEETLEPKLEKGMYTVSRFARMLGDVADLSKTIKAEGVIEGGDKKDSEVAKTLITQLGSFGDSFMEYAKQQIGEMVAGLDTDLTPRGCYDYYYRAAEADPENSLAKDVCELIASVEPEREASLEKMAKLAPEVEAEDTPETLQKLAKLEGENERLVKVVTDATELMGSLEKRLKVVEEKPEPRAPRGNVMAKADDINSFRAEGVTDDQKNEMLAELIKTKSPEELSLMMIKAAQTKPQSMTINR